jgi:hypothetical protein
VEGSGNPVSFPGPGRGEKGCASRVLGGWHASQLEVGEERVVRGQQSQVDCARLWSRGSVTALGPARTVGLGGPRGAQRGPAGTGCAYAGHGPGVQPVGASMGSGGASGHGWHASPPGSWRLAGAYRHAEEQPSVRPSREGAMAVSKGAGAAGRVRWRRIAPSWLTLQPDIRRACKSRPP